eukprot:scaffold30802_cov61-Phaeocystis_antarctica.AAC.4
MARPLLESEAPPARPHSGSASRPEPQLWRHSAKHKLTQPDFRLCWRSSHEELRCRGRSRPADSEEPREAMVRRGHQHHTVEAVSAFAAPVKVVALRRVDEPFQDEPPLPAGDGQHDGGTFTSIVRHAVESVTAETPTRERHVRHAREAKPRAAATNTQQGRRSTCGRRPAR